VGEAVRHTKKHIVFKYKAASLLENVFRGIGFGEIQTQHLQQHDNHAHAYHTYAEAAPVFERASKPQGYCSRVCVCAGCLLLGFGGPRKHGGPRKMKWAKGFVGGYLGYL